MQWLVEAGGLEVEGVENESLELMMTKYEGMHAEALETFRNEAGVIEGVRGFRLVRRNRELDPCPRFEQGGPWSCVPVCFSPAPARGFGMPADAAVALV